jgi:type II secretory pathway pseudopilin PulG
MIPLRSPLKTQSGFSLLELIATVVMSFVILGVSLSLITTQRRQYLNQQANTDINQTLQSAMDFMGTDIRQAGEKVGPGLGLPIVRLINGAAGAPDELWVQRKLLDTALNVCEDVSAGVRGAIKVSDKSSPPVAGCSFSDDATLPKVPNAISDDVDAWKNFRCRIGPSKNVCTNVIPNNNCTQNGGSNDECSWAYIYDPIQGRGEFFVYYGENTTDQILVSATFANSYPVANQPKIYILEQRHYFLSAPVKGDRILNLETRDRDEVTSYKIVNRLRDFQLKGLVANAWFDTGFNESPVGPYADWQTLQSVEVTLNALNSGPDANPTIQTLASQFFPRNSLSRP